MIKTIIIDDDQFHIDSLINILTDNFKQIEIIAYCNNVPEGVDAINKLKPQLIFLDIEMSPYTGFDLLEMVDERDFEVIFTTSYQRYAIQAIKASALDYIEKPVEINILAEAISRFKEKTGKLRMKNLLNNFGKDSSYQKIALNDNNGLNFFETNNIIRCESDNSFTVFYIKENSRILKFTVSKGLYYFEDYLLDLGSFYRVHNKHIININHIKKFVKETGGYLLMNDNSGITIPVARARKDDFLNFLRLNKFFF